MWFDFPIGAIVVEWYHLSLFSVRSQKGTKCPDNLVSSSFNLPSHEHEWAKSSFLLDVKAMRQLIKAHTGYTFVPVGLLYKTQMENLDESR